MIYHAHFTLDPDRRNVVSILPKGFKKTDIILENDIQTQTDEMITRHFKLGKDGFKTINDILIYCDKISKDLSCIRYKLEMTDGTFYPITDKNYMEIHCKVKENVSLNFVDWVRSKNPKNLNITGDYEYFWNKRIRESKYTFLELKEIIKKELSDINYTELKFEQVVYDSNSEVDNWWA